MIITATLMTLIFMFLFSEIYQDGLKDKKKILAEDLGYSMQNEFIIASGASSGYRRNFTVPETLEGFPYTISNQESALLLNYTDNVIVFPIPKTSGTIKKGANMIMSTNNSVCINC